MCGLEFAHVQVDVNPHILRMLGGTFSLDVTKLKLRTGPKSIFLTMQLITASAKNKIFLSLLCLPLSRIL